MQVKPQVSLAWFIDFDTWELTTLFGSKSLD